MWYRFGTPTSRAGSGTIEEFQRAKERFDHDPSALQLMIYFKDAPAPVAPSKLDHTQLKKIDEFRNSLGEEGCLYWPFVSVEDFEKLVRLHLTRQVQGWRSKKLHSLQPAGILVSESVEEKPEPENEEEDEPGLLDLMEQSEDEFVTLQEIMERITNATIDVGEKMQARTAETQQFSSGPDSSNRKAAKRLIAKTAADMEQYVYRMEAELPFFSQHLNLGMNALIQASQMSFEITIAGKDFEQVKENLEAVRGLCETLITVEEQISTFQQTVASLPKIIVDPSFETVV